MNHLSSQVLFGYALVKNDNVWTLFCAIEQSIVDIYCHKTLQMLLTYDPSIFWGSSQASILDYLDL
jgi:hypothetical protein